MRIVRRWEDGHVLMLVDAEEWAALSAAVVIAYDELPPGIQPEMAEAAGRLWAGTQEGRTAADPLTMRADLVLLGDDVPVTISREGSFKALVPSPEQCGGVGQRDFTFKAEVTVPEWALDGRGFVVEHDVIQAWFDDRWKETEAISCERMAIEAARELAAVVGRRLGKDPLKVKVAVSGSDIASATATWEWAA